MLCVWHRSHTLTLLYLFLAFQISDYTFDQYYAINKQFSPNPEGCQNGNNCFHYDYSNTVNIIFTQPKTQSLRTSPFLPYITAPQLQKAILRLESLSWIVNLFKSKKAFFIIYLQTSLFLRENRPNIHSLASNTLPMLLQALLNSLNNLKVKKVIRSKFFFLSLYHYFIFNIYALCSKEQCKDPWANTHQSWVPKNQCTRVVMEQYGPQPTSPVVFAECPSTPAHNQLWLTVGLYEPTWFALNLFLANTR